MGASESSAVCPWASEDESCRNGNKTTLSRLLVVLSYMRKPNQGQLTAAGVSVCGYFTSQPLTLAEIDHVIFVLHGSFADSYRLCTGKHTFTSYLPTQIIPDQPPIQIRAPLPCWCPKTIVHFTVTGANEA